MNDDNQRCQLELDEARTVAADLDEFVVAFDQIFSRIAFGEAGPEILVAYMTERQVRQRLAAARSAVFDALEQVIGQEAADEISENGYRHFEESRRAEGGAQE